MSTLLVPKLAFPTGAELHAIGCPNRYAILPCPAKDGVLALLRELAPELALMGVIRIGLFGSVARGDDTPDSDIDVAAQVVDDDFVAHIHIADMIEVHCNRHVDVVPLPLRYPLTRTAAHELIEVA